MILAAIATFSEGSFAAVADSLPEMRHAAASMKRLTASVTASCLLGGLHSGLIGAIVFSPRAQAIRLNSSLTDCHASRPPFSISTMR
jgi:hypothetical protein